ncbi:hypothetical protein [Bradyrhizobium stylosanthis]|uniref:Uncharacterized protein n=1 Tax=Bradyrhizobium stylosanthis TaxID=1803665 RepID=A0A560EAE7_9BRAD|nr:hypothetical protein [Bradyrhizobium stylosanthis]TWB06338.1 hypothetical protein FBZ96_101147 [Bradyrhizobium stylosanthis]
MVKPLSAQTVAQIRDAITNSLDEMGLAQSVKEHWKLIFELTVWRNFLRGAVAFFGLASLVGIAVLPSQLNARLDEAIAGRIDNYDNLYLASIQVANGEADDALNNIRIFSDKILKVSGDGSTWDLSVLTQAQRTIFFKVLLDVLANSTELTMDGASAGTNLWTMLKNNPHFKNEILSNERFANKDRIIGLLGWINLRHSLGRESIDSARDLMARSFYAAKSPSTRRSRALGVAVISLLAEDQRAASGWLLASIDWRTLNEPFEQYDPFELLEPSDVAAVNRQWHALNLGGDLRGALSLAYLEAIKIRRDAVRTSKSASILGYRASGGDRALISRANAAFKKLQGFSAGLPIDTIAGDVTAGLRNSLLSLGLAVDFEEDKIDRFVLDESLTAITDVWQQGNKIWATVQLYGVGRSGMWTWRFVKAEGREWQVAGI